MPVSGVHPQPQLANLLSTQHKHHRCKAIMMTGMPAHVGAERGVPPLETYHINRRDVVFIHGSYVCGHVSARQYATMHHWMQRLHTS